MAASAPGASPTALLTTGKNEYTKSHFVYDGTSGLLEYVYEARANAANGEACLITKYSYDGSDRIENRVEFPGLWDSTWDLTQVVD